MSLGLSSTILDLIKSVNGKASAKHTHTASEIDGLNDALNGVTPQKGIDYWTEEDKAEMVDYVIARLPIYKGEII